MCSLKSNRPRSKRIRAPTFICVRVNLLVLALEVLLGACLLRPLPNSTPQYMRPGIVVKDRLRGCSGTYSGRSDFNREDAAARATDGYSARCNIILPDILDIEIVGPPLPIKPLTSDELILP